AGGGNNAAIGGAAGGRQLGVHAGDVFNGLYAGFHQRATGGYEWQAAEVPVEALVQAVLLPKAVGAGHEVVLGHVGGATEVEHHFQFTRNHVGGAGTGVDVGNLEAGGREKFVAVIPHFGGQFGQRRRGQMHRVFRQMRVSDVALNALNLHYCTQRTPAAVFHHIADGVGGGGFTNNAHINFFVARF